MLTSYLVKCPHFGCGWFGSLLPSGSPEAWRGSVPAMPVVSFQCPKCGQEWHARVIGDDVKPLPLEKMIAQHS